MCHLRLPVMYVLLDLIHKSCSLFTPYTNAFHIMPTKCKSTGRLDTVVKAMRSFRAAVKLSIQQGVKFKKTRTFINTVEKTQTFTERTIFSEICMSEQKIL